MTGTEVSTEVATEIASFEPMLGNHGSDYWRGSRSAELQQRYRSLLEARDPGAPPPAKATAAAVRIAELEKMMGNHGSAYWRGPRSAELRAEYQQLKSGGVVTAPSGAVGGVALDALRAKLDPVLVRQWDETGNFAGRLATAQAAIANIRATLDGGDDKMLMTELACDLDGFILPQLKRAIFNEFAMPLWSPLNHATDGEIALFTIKPEGRHIFEWWGARASRNVAVVMMRFKRFEASLDAASLAQCNRWFWALPPIVRTGVYHALAAGA